MPIKSEQVNVRMTETGKDLLQRVCYFQGISQGSLLEILVRQEARRLGIAPERPPEPQAQAH